MKMTIMKEIVSIIMKEEKRIANQKPSINGVSMTK